MFYCYQTLCFSIRSNDLNAYKQFVFILTVDLWNVFFPSEILCCVFKFYWLSDESIYTLINEN